MTEDPRGTPAPGYRLPSATRLGRVRLQVADLDRSLAYYTNVLGLGVVDRAAGGASLGPADGDGVLVELRERSGATPVPPRGRLGLFHFAILLPDRGALGALLEHLSTIGAPPGASDHLVSEALYLRDPDGLGIEVYADRPRATWRWRGGQLAMATEPLDAAGLLRAAGGRPWRGMPAGTTVGHVHLHVGDLAAASRFYHDGLGLDKVVWSYPGALFLSAGGYHHHLGVNTWAAGAAPAGDDDARLLHWELLVPGSGDVAAAAASLEAAGHAAERAGDAVVAQDPWGTRLRIRAEAP